MEEKDQFTSTEEHRRLASVVKNVHADLRKKLRTSNGDFEAVWTQHCQNQPVLSEYAESMKALAQDHWTKNSHTRIDWCRDAINEYFRGGGLKKALEREAKKRDRLLRDTKSPQRQAAVPDRREEDAGGDAIDAGNSAAGEGQEATETSDRLTPAKTCDRLTPAETKDEKDLAFVNPQEGDPGHIQDDENFVSDTRDEADEKYTRVQLPFEGKVRLLDVGSCYNPFQQFEEILAIAVDISPATESVHRCDFLRLRTTTPQPPPPPPSVQQQQRNNSTAAESVDRELLALLTRTSSPVDTLPASAFHVVVFCLLLEYLPAPEQRWRCCVKARQLLQRDGLLIIITPDSKSQHRNAPMIHSWKTAIESLGFCRWRYVKLEHLHCMAFRKTSSPPAHTSAPLRHHDHHHTDSTLQHPKNDDGRPSPQQPLLNAPSSGDGSCDCSVASYASMMYIPQDFRDFNDDDEEEEVKKDEFLGPEDRHAFCSAVDSELPGFALDDSEEEDE